jgi:hypothetical protein
MIFSIKAVDSLCDAFLTDRPEMYRNVYCKYIINILQLLNLSLTEEPLESIQSIYSFETTV